MEGDCQLQAIVCADDAAEGALELSGPVPVISWTAVAAESDSELTAVGTIDRIGLHSLHVRLHGSSQGRWMIAHRTIATFVDWSCHHFNVTSMIA